MLLCSGSPPLVTARVCPHSGRFRDRILVAAVLGGEEQAALEGELKRVYLKGS